MRPFNALRACFYLLALVIIARLAGTIFAALGCFYMNLTGVRTIGACLPIIEMIREEWAEIIAAIFALLLAARNMPPPSPPDEGDEKQ